MRLISRKQNLNARYSALIFCIALIFSAASREAYAQETATWNVIKAKSGSQGNLQADSPIHAADLFFPGDDEYDRAFSAAIREGRVPKTNVFPLFGSELGASLSTEGAKALSGIVFRASTPTLYYDSPAEQKDLATSLLDDPNLDIEAFPEIMHFWQTLPDVLALGLNLYPSASIAFNIDISFNYRRDKIVGQSSPFQWDIDDFRENLTSAAQFPLRAYIAWVGEGYGLALGRFPSGMGWGTLSGSILNPRASSYDQVRFYFESGPWRFTSMTATSSAQLSNAEQEIQFRRYPNGSNFWDSLNDHDCAAHDMAIKLANWHQIEWKPAPWLELSIAEMSTMGGRMPSLGFILPTTIWHNTYAAGYSNVGVSLSAAIVPFRGLMLSGELFIDDMKGPRESADAKPESLAWLGTARWSTLLFDHISLDTGLEYQHVDRWTYVRWSPYLAMYQRQTLPDGEFGQDQSLGAPWGPDYDSIGAYTNIKFKNGASFRLSYEFIRKGPIYQGMAKKIKEIEITKDLTGDSDNGDELWVPVYYDYDKYAGDGALEAILSRPDEYRHLISLIGTMPLAKAIELQLSTTLGFYRNFRHVEGASETALLLYAGIVVHLPAK
jgi:hypothetical protein